MKTSDSIYEEVNHRQRLTNKWFGCNNNPISPDPIEAKEADETLRKTIRLANL